MEIPRNHRALIEQLATGLRPVAPLHGPALRMLLWMTLPIAVLAGATATHLRTDLVARLHAPAFALEFGLLVASAGLATWLAFCAAAPDRLARTGGLWLTLGLIVGAVAILLAVPEGGLSVDRAFVAGGTGCLEKTVMMAALPWGAFLLALRRGAPVAPGVAGVVAGGAAFLLANVAMRLSCPVDASLHVLAWHLLPAGLGAVLSGAIGASWFGRWASLR